MISSPTLANSLYNVTVSPPRPQINLVSYSWLYSPLTKFHPTFFSPYIFHAHDHFHPLFSPDYFQLLLTGFLVPSSIPNGPRVTTPHHPSLAWKPWLTNIAYQTTLRVLSWHSWHLHLTCQTHPSGFLSMSPPHEHWISIYSLKTTAFHSSMPLCVLLLLLKCPSYLIFELIKILQDWTLLLCEIFPEFSLLAQRESVNP